MERIGLHRILELEPRGIRKGVPGPGGAGFQRDPLVVVKILEGLQAGHIRVEGKVPVAHAEGILGVHVIHLDPVPGDQGLAVDRGGAAEAGGTAPERRTEEAGQRGADKWGKAWSGRGYGGAWRAGLVSTRLGSGGVIQPMRIVLAASELFPYIKTGGLADAVGALASALAEKGHEVSVFIPGYRSVLEHPEAGDGRAQTAAQGRAGRSDSLRRGARLLAAPPPHGLPRLPRRILRPAQSLRHGRARLRGQCRPLPLLLQGHGRDDAPGGPPGRHRARP